MSRLLPLLLALLLPLVPAQALAQALEITEIRAPVLMIWADTEGSSLVAEIPKGDVQTPLTVQSVSKNLMLKATVEGKTGWIFGHHVKTNKEPKLEAGCDETVASEDVGATRGLGEGCQ